MFPNIDGQALRRGALAAIQSRAMPRDPPLQMWGGRGSGETCPVCGQACDPAEAELELEFAPLENNQAPREFHLHLACFEVWDLVRTSAPATEA